MSRLAGAVGGRRFLAPSLLAVACLALYGLTGYFGVRSPDAEIVFRTARSIAEEGTFALREEPLPWQGFGTARGVDGRSYSVFGPLQPLAAAPFIAIAAWSEPAEQGAGEGLVGISHYVDGGLQAFLGRTPPPRPGEHLLRSRTAVFNVVVSTLLVLAFYYLALRLTGSIVASALVAVLFAFGTLVWPYSGTFFSEPLALLLWTLSLLGLLPSGGEPRGWSLFLSGLALGLASAAHLSAVLFAPFAGLLVLIPALRRRRLRNALSWTAGLLLILLLLGWHNQARFGELLETGRGAGDWHYAQWVSPIAGALGLTLSWGKGLIWFCPIVLLGLVFARKLQRAAPAFASWMLAAIVFRLLFLAGRSDWHGGFCLGPRYLLLTLPIFLLPLALALRDQIAGGHRKSYAATGAFSVLCVCQQLYFSLGEIFSYLHGVKLEGLLAGRDVFKNDALYFDPAYSPLLRLLAGRPGPLLLQGYGGSLLLLWLFLAVLLAAAMTGLLVWAWKVGRRG